VEAGRDIIFGNFVFFSKFWIRNGGQIQKPKWSWLSIL